VSEIEFCTLYVVAERWILGCILRFMHAKNHFSDTLSFSPRHVFSAVSHFPEVLVCCGYATEDFTYLFIRNSCIASERGPAWTCFSSCFYALQKGAS
jgi:hypothetical protein